MDFDSAKDAINGIAGKFSSLIQDSAYVFKEENISWNPYRPGIDKFLAYAKEYEKLLEERQYSFLLIDDSLIQFFYDWEDGELKKARLAYYPKPLKVVDAKEELLEFLEEAGTDALMDYYFGAVDWMENGVDIVNTSHLRLDYDKEATSHSSCHVQLGAINEVRISSVELINPVVFWDWLISQTLKKEYSQICEARHIQSFLKYQFSKGSLSTPHNDSLSLSKR